MFGAMPQHFFKYIFYGSLLVYLVACKEAIKKEAPKGYNKINDSLYFSVDGKGSERLLNMHEVIYLQTNVTNAFDIEIPFTKPLAGFDTITPENAKQYEWLLHSLHKIHQHDTVTFVMNARCLSGYLKHSPSIKLADAEWVYVHLILSQASTEKTSEADSTNHKTESQASIQVVEASEEKAKKPLAAAPAEVSRTITRKAEDMPHANADEFEKEAFTLRYFLEYTRPELLKFEIEPGLFIRIINKGKGRAVKFGDIVSVDYVGKFAMNGKKFDDSTLNPEPLDFVMGKPDQLLKGIEKALYKLKEGGRAEVYFTSRFGYGAAGSSTGIVGKYKSLSFVVHLKKIRNK
jgi:FKBP-type peptidyl-prolyl cis-trans isomerase